MTEPRPTAHRPEVQSWIHALQSGTYTQGIGQLVLFPAPDWETDAEQPVRSIYRGQYCCLGVAEEVRGCKWIREEHTTRFIPVRNGVRLTTNGSLLSDETAAWLGLTISNPFVTVPGEFLAVAYQGMGILELSMLNDSVKLSLFKIGQLIELQDPDWDGSRRFAAEQSERWRGRTS